jgi:peptidoglycan/xylan/chitin deacetylase (PgdA/CDA1 family)
MAWLTESGYPVISLDQAVRGLARKELPHCATVVTIDDGWYGTYLHMLPLLEQYSLPATLYVYTDAVDSQQALAHIMLPALVHLSKENRLSVTDPITASELHYDMNTGSAKKETGEKIRDMVWRLETAQIGEFARTVTERLGFDYDQIIKTRQFSFMNYDEICEANRRGLDIQLHTHSHRLNREIPQGIETEIVLNRKRLSPHVTSSLEHFCYPGGVHCAEMHPFLDRNGIRSAVLVDTGLVNGSTGIYELKRILDGEHVSQLQFEAEMSGFMELVRDAKKMLGGWRRHALSENGNS